VAITNGYCTLNDVKAALNLEDSLDNAALELAIATASRQIDDYCGRFFYKDGTELLPATR
jgi:phage gp36-like protein